MCWFLQISFKNNLHNNVRQLHFTHMKLAWYIYGYITTCKYERKFPWNTNYEFVLIYWISFHSRCWKFYRKSVLKTRLCVVRIHEYNSHAFSWNVENGKRNEKRRRKIIVWIVDWIFDTKRKKKRKKKKITRTKRAMGPITSIVENDLWLRFHV